MHASRKGAENAGRSYTPCSVYIYSHTHRARTHPEVEERKETKKEEV